MSKIKELKNSFDTLISTRVKNDIESLFSKIDTDDELEFLFASHNDDKFRMGTENYMRVLNYIKHKGQITKKKLERFTTLDVVYSKDDTRESFRITIDGIKSINKYMETLHLRRNHVIFSVLAELLGKDKNLKLIKKIRNFDNIITINEFDMKVRMCKEKDVTKLELENLKVLNETMRNNILFRYKQRVTLFLEDNKEVVLRIDLTSTKMSNNINNLEQLNPIYELEIDFMTKTKNPNKKYLETIYNEATVLLKVIQQSNYLITNEKEFNVVNSYSNLLGFDLSKLTSLQGRKAQSLEVQHVVDQLPNKYTVTDKADGERFFLIILEGNVYLISENLKVKNLGITLSEKQKKYNNVILDGEYIFLPKFNRHLFLVFDCLYLGDKDIRQEPMFFDRLKIAQEVVKECFIFKGQKGYEIREYDIKEQKGAFDIKKILDFHDKQINEYMKNLNSDLDVEKKYPLIRTKYFIPVYGAKSNEIFQYSDLLWRKYVQDVKTGCPYILDGLVYHPLNQKYISTKESKLVEYKWKPPEKNSIDFYILFERDIDTNQVLTVYDNSKEEFIKGKPYKIVNLYVGKKSRNGEQPVLFQMETNKHIAHLFLENGEVRDKEGKIIEDGTVVEFYYDNNPNIPELHRWVPLRTRYDRTESVRRFGKKYGNYVNIANRIWRSIKNPVLMDDFITLSNDDMYDKHIDVLRGKIDHSVIMSERQENVYYQIRTTLAKPMRHFHHFITSIVMYTIFNPDYEGNRQLKILDIGCRRGEDIMKFYYAKVDFYVGIDINNNGIISPVDGAISRYNRFRKNKPNFPRMFFINADGGTVLDYDDQSKIIGSMSVQNRNLMNQFFSKDPKRRTYFDRINCQFTISNFLKNRESWANFIENINMYLLPGGFLLITCFDAQRILDALKDKEQYTTYYTNKNGEQKVLFEIVKKFGEIKKDNIGIGVSVDYYNALEFQEGVYLSEYLVDRKFLEKEFKEKCNMELVDTDLYDNQFQMNEEYFEKYAEYESNPDTRNFLMSAGAFYDKTDSVNEASMQITKLNRFYVFRKMGEEIKDKKDYRIYVRGKKEAPPQKNKKEEKKQKGGLSESDYNSRGALKSSTKLSKLEDKKEELNELKNLSKYLTPKKYYTKKINELPDYSFMMSIHDILKTEKKIPTTSSMIEFVKDLEIEPTRDEEIDDKYINNFNKNLVIGHEVGGKLEKVLDGLNIIVVDKNENIKVYSRSKKINKMTPSIIIYKEGERYFPVYKNREGNYNGIYDTRMKFIRDIINNEKK